MDIYNLVSLAGLFVLIGVAWALSADRRRMNVRAIGWGVGLQLALGALVFWLPYSRDSFRWLNDVVVNVLTTAQEGQKFLFGRLALQPGQTGPKGETSLGFFLAIQALPVIIFFSAVMALLYHWRIMPRIIRAFAWVFTRLMRVSGAESLCAASNIFVGIESATTVRPYLERMTRSELCTILTAGMATVASSTMAVYVFYLKDVFDGIAGHLISASILSAPAAIVMSKVLLPERGEPITLGRTVQPEVERYSGAIDAIIAGATAGVKLVVGICALLIAFLGILAVIDLALGALGGWLAGQLGWAWASQLSLIWLLGQVFRPIAALIGVPWSDARLAGELLGRRLVATELPSYESLAELMNAGAFRHPRSAVVIAYALCGFAHVASLAIFVGGIAALVPSRRKDLAAVGPRALLAATLACLMTGAVAGTFFIAQAPGKGASRPAPGPPSRPASSPSTTDAAGRPGAASRRVAYASVPLVSSGPREPRSALPPSGRGGTIALEPTCAVAQSFMHCSTDRSTSTMCLGDTSSVGPPIM